MEALRALQEDSLLKLRVGSKEKVKKKEKKMKIHDENELYDPGQLYKAVSETVLVEVEPAPLISGMKLLLHPEQIRILKLLQKSLRSRLGFKPKIELVLNALVATTDVEQAIDGVAAWLEEHSEGEISENQRAQTPSLYPLQVIRNEYREESEQSEQSEETKNEESGATIQEREPERL